MTRLPHLELSFPKLADAGYDKTSETTGLPSEPGSYNCISYAANDPYSRWWWPSPVGYWPPWAKKREETVACFVRTFSRLGYMVCAGSHKEFAFEKIALYAIHISKMKLMPPGAWRDLEEWRPTHMARQLRDGTWSSKCGGLEDITHYTLDALESYEPRSEYGIPVVYMKRLLPIAGIVRFIQRMAWKPRP